MLRKYLSGRIMVLRFLRNVALGMLDMISKYKLFSIEFEPNLRRHFVARPNGLDII